MTGLLYKELRQNRLYIIFSALFPLIFFAFTFAMLFGGEYASIQDAFLDITGRADPEQPSVNFMLLLPLIGGFFGTGLMQNAIFVGDETKKWGYFTASHPKGIRTAVYFKYVVVFLMSLLTMVSMEIVQTLYWLTDHLILGTTSENMPQSMSEVFMICVFLQIFLRMSDIPFMIRFGANRGSSVKVLIMLGLLAGGGIYLLFGPLPENASDIIIAYFDFMERVQSGEADYFPYLVLALFTWVTIGGYYLSYKISCKLYLKGVEQYVK